MLDVDRNYALGYQKWRSFPTCALADAHSFWGNAPALRTILAVWSVAVLLVAVPSAVFEEIPASTGIDFRHENSPTSNKYLPETMGGGVALLDYDNDGKLDIFFTN